MKDDRTVSTLPAAPITRLSPMSLSGHSRGTRVGSVATRQHAGDHALRRAIATSPKRHAIAGPGAFSGLCDDEGVPLICPTRLGKNSNYGAGVARSVTTANHRAMLAWNVCKTSRIERRA